MFVSNKIKTVIGISRIKLLNNCFYFHNCKILNKFIAFRNIFILLQIDINVLLGYKNLS